MKSVKMSLAAALLMSASAFALDNVKVDGSAAVFYGTYSDDYFDQATSFGEAAVNVGATADFTKNLSGGMRAYVVDTLNLEQEVVGGLWTNAMAGNETLDTASWVSELYVAYKMGNTTAKVGIQDLDTPLAFTETWNIAPNSFEAYVLMNEDLPDTTLVGAFINKHNGAGSLTSPSWATVGVDGQYSTFYTDGAYAVAAVNKSVKDLTAQLWYYDIVDVAGAYWAQADYEVEDGIVAGAQYGLIDPDASGVEDSSGYAFKLGYNGIKNLSTFVAYSKTDKDGVLGLANTATGTQSKLYTEAWWNFTVGSPDTEAYNFTAEYEITDVADLGLYVTDAESDSALALESELLEATLSVSKSFGDLDTSIAYTYVDRGDSDNGDDCLQVYLTYNF
jgi:imipenem/basic amino acid-specific outer membrane pore